jgi:hypothetical protein
LPIQFCKKNEAMEKRKDNVNGNCRGGSYPEIGRIEVGRYVRFYDLSGDQPCLVFELFERPFEAKDGAGPAPEDHVAGVIDFFERLVREEVQDGH